MNEKGKNRREWVKTAAIVFLSVMLVLTFFSNTIMNYSLPEVATQYVQSGTITTKIRGTGMVESGDPYYVEVKESRKVASVAVREGDEVQKGDILVYLEDVESEELKAALKVLEGAQEVLKERQDAVEEAQEAYSWALLNKEIDPADIQAANGGTSAAAYRSRITEYQNAIQALKDELVPLQDTVAELTLMMANIDAQVTYERGLDTAADQKVTATRTAYYNAAGGAQTDAVADAYLENQRAVQDSYKTQYETAKAALDNAQAALDAEQGKASPDPDQVTSLTAARDQAQTAYQNAYNTYHPQYESQKAVVDSIQGRKADYEVALRDQNSRESSSVYANLGAMKSACQIQMYGAENEVTAKQAAITQKEKELADLMATIGNVETLQKSLDAIANAKAQAEKAQGEVDKAQKEVDIQTAKSTGATITAPIAGRVTEMRVVAGGTTSAATPVAVMQPEGRGYTMSFSVSNDQAKMLSVGDQADLLNAWRYDNVTVTLKNIRPDTTDPGKKKLLTFDIKGNATSGQQMSVSVGQKSANYDYIVPNSAIREDNNGKFILIVEAKSSPLGTRYMATRTDVEVIAGDDTQSAIRGAVNGYEFVITTSTKPVEAGKQVRLNSK